MNAQSIRPLRTAVAVVVCTVAVCVLTLWVELVMHAATLTFTYPPLNAFFILLVILGIYNPVCRRTVPGMTLSTAELLVTYSVVSVGAGLVSTRYAMFLPALIAAPAYYAGPGNSFQAVVDQTPSWLRMGNISAATPLFEGIGSAGAAPWGAWVIPVAAWTILMAALGFVLCAIGLLLSRRWIEDERLAFPLAQIPLEVSAHQSDHRALAPGRGRLFVLGLALVVGQASDGGYRVSPPRAVGRRAASGPGPHSPRYHRAVECGASAVAHHCSGGRCTGFSGAI